MVRTRRGRRGRGTRPTPQTRRGQTQTRRRNTQNRSTTRGRLRRRPTRANTRANPSLSPRQSMEVISNFLSECEENLENCNEQQRYLNEMLDHIANHARSVSARQSQTTELFQGDSTLNTTNSSSGSQNAFQSIPDSVLANTESAQTEDSDRTFPVPGDRLMLAAQHDVFVVPVGSVHFDASDDANVLTVTITLNKDDDELGIFRRPDEGDKSE